ncbi:MULTISPECIES: DUF1684 domain-containing protein [Lysobacter]|uniref:DUF1684 domain-containing protein n=1 Tax=Lysobacter TaxID=68 RepID=UPI001F3824B9|nr:MULTISPECIES: DUF1684 domain-containing protein [Lysobacter]UJB17222.1 DUF1684 domain-containing protein [Lysobacter capsici]UJQ29055.1 DUF1684 domain-containing protein [Lysobacter gummosus]
MRPLLYSALLLGLSCAAHADPRQDWDAFRAAMIQQASGPTGMYAIQDVTVIAAGAIAHLPAGQKPADARWAKDAGGKDEVRVGYRDGKAIVEGPGVAATDLLKAKDQQQALPNGLTVRGTVYEDSLKVWLYNPARVATHYKGMSFFPYDPKGVVTATFTRKDVPVGVSHLDSRNHTGLMYWIGDVQLPIQGKTYTLRAFNKERDWSKINHVLMFVTDKTSKKTSYGGGRAVGVTFEPGAAPKTMTVNLNTMYSFLCAHSDYFNCPINLTTFVPVELKYGEKYPPGGH